MRAALKRSLNALLAQGGLRVVNRHWGPRGSLEACRSLKRAGIRPNLVFDVGAAQGTWTEETLSVFSDAHYVLVDPLPENVDALKSVSKTCRSATVVSAAVGAQKGELDLYVHGDQSSFLKSEFARAIPVQVPVRTCDDIFDEVCRAHPSPQTALLKIDVQGFELEVLRGAEQMLKHCDALLVETSIQRIYEGSALAHDVIAYLGSRGFCIFDVASYAQRPRDHALSQVDFAFVREDLPAMAQGGWA